MIPESFPEFLHRLRSAEPAVRRAWLVRAVRVRMVRRRRAAVLIAARLR